MVDEPGNVAFNRQSERENLWTSSLHLGAFNRVVVEEYEAVESEVELLGKRL